MKATVSRRASVTVSNIRKRWARYLRGDDNVGIGAARPRRVGAAVEVVRAGNEGARAGDGARRKVSETALPAQGMMGG